jgi:uncharacterized protein (DUF2249 family)
MSEPDERVLDAREIDGPPFDRIVAAVEELSAGETLILVNSFEPRPLYDVLDERGFDYRPEQADTGEWRVTIEHE